MAEITLAGAVQEVPASCMEFSKKEISFNHGWKFCLGAEEDAANRVYNDSDWDSITLPHDFSISQSFTTAGEAESGFLPGGVGWYRKTFLLSKSCGGKSIVLGFDGAYANAYVYVNGHYIGENHYGYAQFAFELAPWLYCDGATENVIAVKVVNKIPSSRWYSGSGIYRDVTLRMAEPVHLARFGVFISTPDIDKGQGTIQVQSEIVNNSENALRLTLTHTVFEKSSNTPLAAASCEITVPAGETALGTNRLFVENPKLWSVDEPNLYQVQTAVSANGRLLDEETTVFGFRYCSFDESGFHLNGKNIKLNGVCLHPDQGALGAAAYGDAIARQLRLMKDMGTNAVRTSHNPHARRFMELCNEMGLLVVEDTFDSWNVARNGNIHDFSEYFLQTISPENTILGGRAGMNWSEYALRALIRRDRNDPALILYSLANEIQEGGGASLLFPQIAKDLIRYAQEEDPTRAVTTADNTKGSNPILAQVAEAVLQCGGILGYNYASGTQLDSVGKKRGVIISSETSSSVNSRSMYASMANAQDADSKFHLTSYDTSTVGWGMTAHDSLFTTMTRDFVAGEFIWTGFDYIGEPTPWNGVGRGSVSGAGAIPNSSYFGVVETTGFPKDTFYFYRSQWNQNSPTLHLVTAWDEKNMLKIHDKTLVWVYSNVPKLELYRNGVLVGAARREIRETAAGHRFFTYQTESRDDALCEAVQSQGADSLYVAFYVAFAPGCIEAKAFDETGAPVPTVGRNMVFTPKAPARVQLTADCLDASAGGLVYLTADITDASGVLDTTAVHAIRFLLEGNGEILGVDNGDQATTEKYQQKSVLLSPKEAKIAAFGGKALAIIRASGSFTVRAFSEGLQGNSITVQTPSVEKAPYFSMVKDFTGKVGTKPTLQTEIHKICAGKALAGSVKWEEIPEAAYQTPGHTVLQGSARFPDKTTANVTCRLHTLGKIAAMQNIAAVTAPGCVPQLPSAVWGMDENGHLRDAFCAIWEEMHETQFAQSGAIVPVQGSAAIFGMETLPVTAFVRVAEENMEEINVAPQCMSLQASGKGNPQGLLSGGEVLRFSGALRLTYAWATAQLLSSAKLHFANSLKTPPKLRFFSSFNGVEFTEVPASAKALQHNLAEISYTFPRRICPVALRIEVEAPEEISLAQIALMRCAEHSEPSGSADLTTILQNGAPLAGFRPEILEYEVETLEHIAAASAENAGITVLPTENAAYIHTISENQRTKKQYVLRLKERRN